jgi:hypothetical protein
MRRRAAARSVELIKDNPHWNEVTIFQDSTQGCVTKHIDKGDLVFARGRIRQNSYDKIRTARRATRSTSFAPTSRAWRSPPRRPPSKPRGAAPGGPPSTSPGERQ